MKKRKSSRIAFGFFSSSFLSVYF